MNLPEDGGAAARVWRRFGEEMVANTYDEELERLKGHTHRESGYRERREVDEDMGDHFMAEKDDDRIVV